MSQLPPSRFARPRGKGYRERQVGTRQLVETFLIVCEGEKTEPNYFRAFRVPVRVVKVVGLGENTVSLISKAGELKAQDEYDQVWCVFDRDSFPPKRFTAALKLAREKGIRVAYSNESFELWYLLHFHYCDAAITRAEYCNKLSELIPGGYQKNSETMYEELRHRQADAIRNATRLLQRYSPCRPHLDNPSTTVHLLVQELNRFVDRG